MASDEPLRHHYDHGRMSKPGESANPLLTPIDLGPLLAPNRVMFGPHETNLADGRSFSQRHVAYYEERAAGGAGIIVTEEASVHDSDWPYERCPLASESAAGWESIVEACRPYETVVVGAIGHSGGQGSSAFHQAPLWAPSDEPEVNTREVPKIMELGDIADVVSGFGLAAKIARDAGLDGVEINVGQHSLVRQFLSGLTNRRVDRYGADRQLLLHEVLTEVRSQVGTDRVVGLRLSCDELAPWAGITPDHAAEVVAAVSELIDYLVVARGSIFTVNETRPTSHHGAGFNLDLASKMRVAAANQTIVFAQGSIVDVEQAASAVADGLSDGVEMTRAQIADPNLVQKLQRGLSDRIRPCVLCNQVCKVRDNRNPIITCVGDPRAGHETTDPLAMDRSNSPGDLLVVGAGPAGLEAARVASLRGHRVRLVEMSSSVGGMASVAANGIGHERLQNLILWLEAECLANGVTIQTNFEATKDLVKSYEGAVILATGSVAAPLGFDTDGSLPIVGASEILADPAGGPVPGSDVAVWDPIGGPIGVSVAELLSRRDHVVHLFTPDGIAGNLLSLSGDLAGSNVRLQQAGVKIHRRVKLRSILNGEAQLEHVMTGAKSSIQISLVVDAGPRLPSPPLSNARSVGDGVAPRTVAEAVREGRQAAIEFDTSRVSAREGR